MKSTKVLLSVILVLVVALTACQEAPAQVSQEAPAERLGGVTLRFFGPELGPQFDLNEKIFAQFEAETNIQVEQVPGSASATDRLQEYLITLGNESPEFDVYQIDVIWPGILADHMVDLNRDLGDEAEQHFQPIVRNNTVNGRLVGMPWYTDAGLLYYRTDLLEKYGFDSPPETWDELEQMAQTIQEGEQSAGNGDFWGFVWQGNDYEGLTCDALEWQVSHGGGQIIQPDGSISVNNPQAIAAFERAASWVGSISPSQITQWLEEDSRLVWQAGNAAFMRNWPYAYSLGNSDGSPINGLFDVTLLPDGGGGHAATLGGWQLSVAKYSRHQDAAIRLVEYMTSPEVQKIRSVEGSYAPTIASLYEDAEVVEANPYYTDLADVFSGGAVARPSSVSGEAYAEVSYDYFNAVHDILTGEPAAQVLAQLEENLQTLVEYEDSIGPVSLRMVGPNREAELELVRDLAQEFTAETGYQVEVVPGPESTTDRLQEYLIALGSGSDQFDVMMIDVIWPGIVADHMVDLNQYLDDDASQHFDAIVNNNTVNGRLVGMPWYTDAGLLYYRTDLLEQYGFDGPPQTWDELEQMAQTIQEGERGSGNADFWGFVWQGNDYEGLTCDALEWQVSHGGGRIIEPDGAIAVNNPQAIAAFERAAGWVGSISPPEVTQWLEEDSRLAWQAGNAAFMRNWPYAYSLGNSADSPIQGNFDVTLLPDGGGGHAATLGGWQLSVPQYSSNPAAAAQLVGFLTSPEIQKQRAIEQSFAPTIASLYEDAEVVEANPYYTDLAAVFDGGAVARPSSVSGEAYAEVSFDYFNAVNDILTGEPAAEVLAQLEENLSTLADYEASVGGQVTIMGPARGSDFELVQASVAEFTAETGIQVELLAGPESTTDRLQEYLIMLGSESSDVDVYQIDVIWPGILAQHMVDLNRALGDEAEQHFEAIVSNNTVNGRLVGMPWYTDAGLLYYRTDLLEQYGFDGPPQTWDELEQMAQTIQQGERSAGNAGFWGYVWQGNDYEGLTCDALEWQVSHGGGQIIEPDGTITINNPQAIAAFERAASWVGSISPPEVTQWLEEDSRLAWQAGNAAFMRNWPYAYSLGNSADSPIQGNFDVTLLPDGGGGHAATLGGWQLSVSQYSNNQQAAIRLVEFLTSREVQKTRAIEGSFAPTIADLYQDSDVVAANPYYTDLANVFSGGAVARPSAVSGEAYAEVSFDYFNAVHDILTGDQTAAEALIDLEDNLIDLADYESAAP